MKTTNAKIKLKMQGMPRACRGRATWTRAAEVVSQAPQSSPQLSCKGQYRTVSSTLFFPLWFLHEPK